MDRTSFDTSSVKFFIEEMLTGKYLLRPSCARTRASIAGMEKQKESVQNHTITRLPETHLCVANQRSDTLPCTGLEAISPSPASGHHKTVGNPVPGRRSFARAVLARMFCVDDQSRGALVSTSSTFQLMLTVRTGTCKIKLLICV